MPEEDTRTGDEVGQVGTALNRLLDHVETSLHARQDSEMQVRQFVADAWHELRTPLASIRGYAEFIRRQERDGGAQPEDVAHTLRRVESEALRMSSLVDELLLLARLDAGRDLELAEVDLGMVAVDAVSDAHVAAPSHRWRVDVPPVPVLVQGDAARLHQVVANLLGNVRSHTPEGTTATVRLRVEDGAAVLAVVDDGPGIPRSCSRTSSSGSPAATPPARAPPAAPASGWPSSRPWSPRTTARRGAQPAGRDRLHRPAARRGAGRAGPRAGPARTAARPGAQRHRRLIPSEWHGAETLPWHPEPAGAADPRVAPGR